MKFKTNIVLILPILIVFACTGNLEKEQVKVASITPAYDNWVHPQILNNLEFKEVSFPNWFNRAWLKKHAIKSIRIKKYAVSNKNIEQGINFSTSLPVHQFLFYIHKGDVNKFTLKEYYDDILVGNYILDYSTNADSNNYSKPYFNYIPHGKKKYRQFDFLTESFTAINRFNIANKINYDSTFLIYNYPTSNHINKAIYITDSSFWDYYSIDQKLKPTLKDKIVYGSPIEPYKSFYLNNLVAENKQALHYYTSNKCVEKSVYTYKNRIKERSYSYLQNGLFNGFTDSVFIDSVFLSAHQTTIFYDTLQKPYQIIEKQLIDKTHALNKNIWIIDFK